jgi:diguanylate cyclase (GGDEF)-like protein
MVASRPSGSLSKLRVLAHPEPETDAYEATRQAYLDALPIAAAVLVPGDKGPYIFLQNAAFRQLDTPAARERLVSRTDCAARVNNVLTGVTARESFEWRDGDAVNGRHFSIGIASLTTSRDGIPRALFTFVDRTVEIQNERSLRSEMLCDSLTGLPNRQGFIELIEERCSSDSDNQHAVVIVDLARFSRVNECIGSLGGDELLITVARRLKSTLRGYDRLARTGANEFAMIVRIVDGPGDVLHVARRVEDVLAQPCRLSDFEIKVDCAIGCALANDLDKDAERLMRHAQIALKAAKISGRVEFYKSDALAVARRHFIVETELRRAIERGGLTMAYQPLIDLKTGRVTGFEALARWKHPVIGQIPPDEFIRVAEESGLIVPLGRWAIDCALGTLKDWDDAAGTELPIHIAVNLSAIQIARDDIGRAVSDSLKHHGVHGSRLTIELTESAIVGDPDRAGRALTALKACDAMVAMDDFGTGFSNLASLQRLPIDTLKIDRSFVTGMIGDEDKMAIIRAILSLADALGMSTTAEGIETRELAMALAGLGCTTGQGYLYAAPLVAKDALRFAMTSLAEAHG